MFISIGGVHHSPILSLCTTSESRRLHSNGVHLGFPRLLEPGGETHTKIISSWIERCNNRQHFPTDNSFNPTRLLVVGDSTSTHVSLVSDPGPESIKYVVLSHRWGTTDHKQPLSVKFPTMTKDNLQQITSGIEIAELPKTFQDAVTVTRALGLKYLWIDSLCIIQKSSAAGDAESAQDWARESKLMDQVFSQAYFTIAAGCAEHRFDGFLKHRAAREFVTMSTDDKEQFHVCEIIDKFDAEVEQGELNQRGWVLQERALSRRTVHFTATQSYWECGDGILCETFTKTTNRKASFLSDSNFPLAVQAYKEGMTLQLHQNLYERYSTLALSFPTDRPRAIAGLERRLMKALHSKGGYGVFQSSTRNQDFFHRGLLWQRAGKELKRLDGIEGSVPTWSWMAYEGEIRYMNVPFLDIEKNRDIGSPFEDLEEGVVHSDLVDRGPAELRARVWRVREVVKGRVIWDEGEGVQKKGKKVGGGDENQNLKNGRMWCVIVGKSVKPRDEGRIAYVIMVGPVTDLGKDNQGKGKLYQRRGVGYLNVDDLEDEDGGGQEIGSIR